MMTLFDFSSAVPKTKTEVNQDSYSSGNENHIYLVQNEKSKAQLSTVGNSFLCDSFK